MFKDRYVTTDKKLRSAICRAVKKWEDKIGLVDEVGDERGRGEIETRRFIVKGFYAAAGLRSCAETVVRVTEKSSKRQFFVIHGFPTHITSAGWHIEEVEGE